ncbi:hypothetical protein FKM82_024217 [Ascaphus truei]
MPDAAYIFCLKHNLNLCISHCCEDLGAKHVFGLLNRLTPSTGDSHKHMNIWTEQLDKRHGQEKVWRLQKIGETQWWAKDKTLNWVFGEKHSICRLATFKLL